MEPVSEVWLGDRGRVEIDNEDEVVRIRVKHSCGWMKLNLTLHEADALWKALRDEVSTVALAGHLADAAVEAEVA